MSFLFTTCRIGAEATLKKAMGQAHPELKSAFQRPGFVTFKSERELHGDWQPKGLAAVFLHTWGVSAQTVSRADLPSALAALVTEVGAEHLHVYARGLGSDDERSTAALGAHAGALGASLSGVPKMGQARSGAVVADVIVIDDDKLLLGWHRHGGLHSPWPGGVTPLELPEHAPSRAWLKAEEALSWVPHAVRAGDVAVEVGSAPGGTVLALIDRGAKVWAVDPAAMDPQLTAAHGGRAMVHVAKPSEYVARVDLPPSFSWLFIDMNVEPDHTLRIAEKLAAMSDVVPTLALTLKLSEWKLAPSLLSFAARFEKRGYRARVKQLVHGRDEVVLLAWPAGNVA